MPLRQANASAGVVTEWSWPWLAQQGPWTASDAKVLSNSSRPIVQQGAMTQGAGAVKPAPSSRAVRTLIFGASALEITNPMPTMAERVEAVRRTTLVLCLGDQFPLCSPGNRGEKIHQ